MTFLDELVEDLPPTWAAMIKRRFKELLLTHQNVPAAFHGIGSEFTTTGRFIRHIKKAWLPQDAFAKFSKRCADEMTNRGLDLQYAYTEGRELMPLIHLDILEEIYEDILEESANVN